MKGTKEQPVGASILLTVLFLAGLIGMLRIVMDALKSGAVEMIVTKNGPPKLNRANAPDIYWMCVVIYFLAGLGCAAGLFVQLRKTF